MVESPNASSAVVATALLSLLVVHWVQSCCSRRTEQNESAVVKRMEQTLALSQQALRTVIAVVQRGITREDLRKHEHSLFADLGYFRRYRFHLVPLQENTTMRFNLFLEYKLTNAYKASNKEPFLTGSIRSSVESVGLTEEYTIETKEDLDIRLPEYRALEDAWIAVDMTDTIHTPPLQVLQTFPAQLQVEGSNNGGLTWTLLYEGDATERLQQNIKRVREPSYIETVYSLYQDIRPFRFSTI